MTTSTHRPALTPANQPFWEAAWKGRLALPVCQACRHTWFPPTAQCPQCLSTQVEHQPASGRATLLSWVVMHRQYFAHLPAPYTVLFVRLEEGPLMMANPAAGVTPDSLAIGQALQAIFEPAGESLETVELPRFIPIPSAAKAHP